MHPRTLSSLLLAAALIPALAAQEQGKPPAKPDAKPDAQTEKTDKAAAKEPTVLSLGGRADGGITLKDIDGNEHKAKSYQGKITVVNFYSIECPIQAGWDERLAAIHKAFAGKDVVFLSIDSNRTEIGEKPPQATTGEKPQAKEGEKATESAKPYDNIRSHLKAKKLPYTVLADHGNVVADAFGARTTPDVFVFGKDGKLVYRGLVDDDQRNDKGDKAKRYVHEVLTKLVAGEKVEPFQTTPAGCEIKRVPKAAATEAAATPVKKTDGK